MESSGNQRRSTLERFGNYCLLYPLAYGGMAAIYLARTMNAGAGRLLVVKRILPQIASEPMFLNMFRAEIRVCLELTHPNIVQVYDFGDIDGQPYIAMEYVEGKNLRELIERLAEEHKYVPIGISATVIAQAAAALHHAHTARNRLTGEPLGIVHRDVTPHNILVSYAGNAKVIDFGVAKAVVDEAEKTRAGGIKGKVRYLSPEQIQGETLDHRSDIFSLGIVLWESLTSRQLFGAQSDGAAARSGSGAARDFEIMKEIVGCKGQIVPPSRFNPEVQPELDRIALKALHADRDQRYQHAEELHEDLRRFLITTLPGFNDRAVGEQMKAAFADRIKVEQEATRELAARASRLLEAPPPPVVPHGSRGGLSRVIAVPQHFAARGQSKASGYSGQQQAHPSQPSHPYPPMPPYRQQPQDQQTQYPQQPHYPNQPPYPNHVSHPSHQAYANQQQGYSHEPQHQRYEQQHTGYAPHSVIPPGDRGTTGVLPGYRTPPAPPSPQGAGENSNSTQAYGRPTIPSSGVGGHAASFVPRPGQATGTGTRGGRGRRGPQFIAYAAAATLFWGFAIWMSIQHHGSIELSRTLALARSLASQPLKVEEPEAAPKKIRMALNAPGEAAANSPSQKPRPADDNVSVLKNLVSDPLREVSSVVLRIAVEPKSSVPTRVIVNGKPLQGSDQAVPIELGKNVGLRIERPSFIPFEDEVIVTRKDVDRFGIARLTVHLSTW